MERDGKEGWEGEWKGNGRWEREGEWQSNGERKEEGELDGDGEWEREGIVEQTPGRDGISCAAAVQLQKEMYEEDSDRKG